MKLTKEELIGRIQRLDDADLEELSEAVDLYTMDYDSDSAETVVKILFPEVYA